MIEYTQREEKRDRAREEKKDAAIGITWSAFVLFQFARGVRTRINCLSEIEFASKSSDGAQQQQKKIRQVISLLSFLSLFL